MGIMKKFMFDSIITQNETQTDVYSKCQIDYYLKKVLKVSLNHIKGYNVSIFAYGQTGSGKTYTMEGSKFHRGIVPNLCSKMFKMISKLQNETNYKVSCSYL